MNVYCLRNSILYISILLFLQMFCVSKNVPKMRFRTRVLTKFKNTVTSRIHSQFYKKKSYYLFNLVQR